MMSESEELLYMHCACTGYGQLYVISTLTHLITLFIAEKSLMEVIISSLWMILFCEVHVLAS